MYELQTPINGFSKSASDLMAPVALSKLRCGARVKPRFTVSLRRGARWTEDYPFAGDPLDGGSFKSESFKSESLEEGGVEDIGFGLGWCQSLIPISGVTRAYF